MAENRFIKHYLLLALALLALALTAIGAALLFKRGEVVDVRIEYARWLPGSPMPSELDCDYYRDSMFGGYESWYCRLPETRFCMTGYVFGNAEQVRVMSVSRCALPLQALLAEYGRWDRHKRARRAHYLHWGDARLYATVRGWQLNALSNVWSASWFLT